MTAYFQKELERIKKMILALGTMVEERVRMVARAVENTDVAFADQIVSTDYEVDEMEVEIEEECLKILALYQPVAVDLRFLIAVIKINNDLERIGDQAVNIAQRIQSIAKKQHYAFVFDYAEMVEKTQAMLKMSLDALVSLDAESANQVRAMDDEVDAIQREAYAQIKEAMRNHPNQMGYLLNLFLISRHVERIGDHATNIAEEVIYLVEGAIVRHIRPA